MRSWDAGAVGVAWVRQASRVVIVTVGARPERRAVANTGASAVDTGSAVQTDSTGATTKRIIVANLGRDIRDGAQCNQQSGSDKNSRHACHVDRKRAVLQAMQTCRLRARSQIPK